MDLGLLGKTAIVTGGASNIGRAISLAFAQEGANVGIADLDQVQAERVAAEAKTFGGRTIVVKTDVTQHDQVEAMAEKILDAFKKIDILVNVVGWDKPMPFKNTTQQLWERIISVNYISVLHCFKVIVPLMIDQKNGAIVSIGSDAGRVGEPLEAVYAGTKSAVIAFSKSIAKDLGRYGIRVNVVCPGLVVPSRAEEVGDGSSWKVDPPLTPEQIERAAKFYPLRKIGKPKDVANAVVFLASDAAAGNITGQTLSVDGGFTML